MVQRYEEKPLLPSRSDEEIWHEFRKQLEAKHVLVHLRPKRIVAKDYDYEFEHARKNEIWHAYEPVSFDLMDADTILDKANRWLGRMINLQESEEKFRIYMLLGEPRSEKLKPAFGKAMNILKKMPGETEFIPEHRTQEFSKKLADEVANHAGHDTQS